MKVKTNAENRRLFEKANRIRKNIKSEIHTKTHNVCLLPQSHSKEKKYEKENVMSLEAV